MKKCKEFWEEHKAELIAAGITFGTFIFLWKSGIFKRKKPTVELMLRRVNGKHEISMYEVFANGSHGKALSRTLTKNDLAFLFSYLRSELVEVGFF